MYISLKAMKYVYNIWAGQIERGAYGDSRIFYEVQITVKVLMIFCQYIRK